MTMEELRADVARLVGELKDHPESEADLCRELNRRLKEARALNEPFPEDLRRVEHDLGVEFCALSQGR